MFKPLILIIGLVIVLSSSCGKKDDSEGDQNKTTAETATEAEKTGKPDNGSKQTNESKPSALKIELDKLRAKGEPVTLEELNAWHKHPPTRQKCRLSLPSGQQQLVKKSRDTQECC